MSAKRRGVDLHARGSAIFLAEALLLARLGNRPKISAAARSASRYMSAPAKTNFPWSLPYAQLSFHDKVGRTL